MALVQDATATKLPERLGRFEVVARLATGGMAEILLARVRGPHGFERPIVLKRMLPQLARDPVFVRMFLDEARIAARVSHRNVPQLFELTNEADELILAMEYLHGEGLANVVRRLAKTGEHLDPVLAAHVAAEACAGLHAAHELRGSDGQSLSLVHRDVSPQNLFVLFDGTVKVIDFGIAKAADRATRTETGEIKGKLEYMAPEQCRALHVDRRTDLFALGVVLYECVTGHRLFRRPNQLLVFKAICEEPIARPSTVVSTVAPELERIIMRALEREPDARYATAADMRRDLLAFVSAHGGSDQAEHALATLMARLFAERMAEKSEMISKAAAGMPMGAVPVAEPDAGVALPVVEPRTVTAPTSLARPPLVRRAPSSRGTIVGGVAALAVTVAALAWWLGTTASPATPPGVRPEQSDLAASPTPTAAPASSLPASTAVAAPPPSEVTPTGSSGPSGARVAPSTEASATAPADGSEPASPSRTGRHGTHGHTAVHATGSAQGQASDGPPGRPPAVTTAAPPPSTTVAPEWGNGW